MQVKYWLELGSRSVAIKSLPPLVPGRCNRGSNLPHLLWIGLQLMPKLHGEQEEVC